MGPGRELRVGVIGAGGRGGLARHAHRPEEGVRLVAYADTREEVLSALREKFGTDVFLTKDYTALLEKGNVDAVFVTTPDYLHEEHAAAALEAGKDVYVEKPMTITVEGCDHLLRLAFQHKRKLFVGHNMRYMAFTRKMKELVEKGAIGEVKAGWCRHFVGYGGDAFFKDWHAERAKSTSLLLQKGAHDIDILHWVCGGFSQRVTAMGGLTVYGRIADRHDPSERGDASWHHENWPPLSQKGLNPVIDVEDISMMLMALDNGVFASYQQCHYTPDAERNYTIIGTEGRLESFGEVVVRVWDRRGGYNPFGDQQFYCRPPAGSHGGADPQIVSEFIRYVREGGKIATSAVAARYSVAAGCMAADSLRNGSVPRDVPAVPDNIREYFERDVVRNLTG